MGNLDVAAILQSLTDSVASLQAALDAAKKASYDQGFADAQAAAQQPVSDKIYSQSDLDAKIQEAVSPVQAELVAVIANVDGKVSDAVSACKADLLAKYSDLQVAVQASETGFADLLK